jgi:hypothetical protein
MIAVYVWLGALTVGWALTALAYLQLLADRLDERRRLVDAMRRAGPDARKRLQAILRREEARVPAPLHRPRETLKPSA